ncbi:peripheral-type benzodiazepine receptor-associated protein 1 [Alosa sapidissima]|uniref:peripheral-type benzodiazepine receptor-associated protein 1 n=1 Tax=Alosa sapidissima TaxID=34773 RepID=UPI001C093509|nr:peripheral-type benzodiazepine receptor-associated protein 1 [Alosa sapidissima]
MGKDRGNSLVFSSKRGSSCATRSCASPGEAEREIERLRAALEVERCRHKQAQRKFSLELRRVREEGRHERERALRDLTSRQERQKALELQQQREVLGRERASEVRQLRRWRDRERDRSSATLRQARELQRLLAEELGRVDSSGKADTPSVKVLLGGRGNGGGGGGAVYRKLEELLARLHGQASGQQVALMQGLRQELELEKSRFICHLLEKHGRPQQAEQGPRETPTPAPRSRSVSSAHPLSRSASLENHRVAEGSRGASPSRARRSQSQKVQRSSSQQGPVKNRSRSRRRGSMPLGKPQLCSSPMESQALPSQPSPHAGWETRLSSTPSDPPQSPSPDNSTPSRCSEENMEDMNGMDYGFLVRQNSELLRALDDMEKTCATLREENSLLRKSSSPETEEKVKRLRKKNTELAVIAKRLEDRARKLQEANLKVVNSPFPVKAGAVEQYKRAFARQRARDLAQHADMLLSKDKEIAALQQECRELQTGIGQGGKGVQGPCAVADFERLLRESQKEVLRLQRQLSVSAAREATPEATPTGAPESTDKAAAETPPPALDEAPPTPEETPAEEAEPGTRVTPQLSPSPTHPQEQTEEQRIEFLESELSKKRKECESLEHDVRKRQKRCLDLESQLDEERGKNERLAEEAELLRRKAQLLDQSQTENEELRQELSEVSAQHNSVLEENQRLRAKLENLEQVLKHMREVAERRQQLELEHEQALAILKFKQDEIKRLQRAQLFAKREHEGVVQVLEELIQLVLRRELSKVRELEDKCRSQSEQFGMLSQELEKFRLQASKVDLDSSGLLSHPSLTHLTNGLPGETGASDAEVMLSLGDIAFWTLEGTDVPPCAAAEQVDVEAVLRAGSTPHAAGLAGFARLERSPTTKHRELPTISAKSASTSSTTKSDTTHLTPGSRPHSPRKASPTHEVDTASEVEELDIDVSPIPYSASRGAAKLQVFIARYSYNPYDGPNDNPEVELPLTAGEYIYVYGDMDDDGFYEGELMDGRRGLVPSNFVERVSDDDVMSAQAHEAGDLSHNSFQDSSLHSGSERFQPSHHHHHVRFGPTTTTTTTTTTSERTDTSAASSASVPNPAVGKTAPAAPALTIPITNGLDLDLEEVDVVPYPRKLTLIKQLAKSIIIGWEPPVVPAGWGAVWSYNVFVDQELRLNVPFGSQTKAVLERLDVAAKAYRVSVQSLTERGNSDQVRCSLLVGRDVCVAPSQLRAERVTATSATLVWLPSNSNFVHIVSLNEEECELVKAGCYSLCLSNLTPNLQYRVKVEARPHRTPWELPQDSRERKTAVTTFHTLTAGPPDAPLDVQLEQGPSPGIANVSWLPVTIDAAGTSNGVSVTGYTIYADKKKVLEVSSPTAGSALLGPSQIQAVKAAQELTVRTMSPHGESSDSVPVNVQAKLAAIMAGPVPPSLPVPVLAAATAVPTSPAVSPCLTNSPAKMPALPYSLPPDAHTLVPGGGAYANSSKAITANAPLPVGSYMEAWANPHMSVAPMSLAMQQQQQQQHHQQQQQQQHHQQQQHQQRHQQHPPALPPSAMNNPAVYVPVSAALPGSISAALEPHRETESPAPASPRPVVSISDYLEDPSAKLHQHEPYHVPMPRMQAPDTDSLNPPETHPMRPPNPSPFESETEEDLENTRLVSIEEFLGHGRPAARHQGYGGGLVEPTIDYQLENSRGSDLSDILEEEEEDLYSESIADVQGRGYSIAGRDATGRDQSLAEPPLSRSEARQMKEVEEAGRQIGENTVRVFVALFPYDPVSMSPNPDAVEEELPFREGQIIKVYGDKDVDGFFRGECNGRMGYVPCNMVSEIQVDDMETRDQLLAQGFLTTEASMDKIGTTRSHAQLPRRPVPPPKPRRSKKVESAGVWDDSSVVDSSSQDRSQSGAATGNPAPRRMVAIFDYDPRESSPNTDIEAELTFSAGDIIYVFGDMDADGFFYGDLNGHKGLVPSNFLQPFPETTDELGGAAVMDHLVVMDARRDPVREGVPQEQQDLAGDIEPDRTRLPEPEPDPDPEPTLGPLPETQASPSCAPTPTTASDSPLLTDPSSPLGKKKKGFFSKGKKLFKKLGSSKKE